MKDHDVSPEAAVAALISLHAKSTFARKAGLERYLKTRRAPGDERVVVHRS